MYADLAMTEEDEVERVFGARYDVIDDAAQTNAMYSGLTPETAYMYRVAAVNAVGLGAWSNGVTATTLDTDTTLGDASDLMAIPNADGSIALEWTPAPNATHNVVYGTDGTTQLALAYAMADGMHTVPAAKLTDGTLYTFYVIAGQWTEVTEGTWEGEWAPGWTGPAMAVAVSN